MFDADAATQERYVVLQYRASQRTLTPPEEVELREMNSKFLLKAYASIPAGVREEMTEFLDSGEFNTMEFYRGMVHAITWIQESIRHMPANLEPGAIGFGTSVLAMAVHDRIEQLNSTQAANLAKLFNSDSAQGGSDVV